MSAQGSSLRESWDQHIKRRSNPEKGSSIAKPFQGLVHLWKSSPGFSFLEPWADISQRLRRYRRYFKLMRATTEVIRSIP